MRVDDPGRHERAPGVDHELAVGREVGPDLDDDAVARPDVGNDRRRARAVDDRPAGDQHVRAAGTPWRATVTRSAERGR